MMSVSRSLGVALALCMSLPVVSGPAFAGGPLQIESGAGAAQPRQDSAITTRTLLEEMLDRDAIARFPSPAYIQKQDSSYDRASTSADDQSTWFANNDRGMYLRTEQNQGRTEYVMMDATGPGAITRFWSANPAGTLRVYIDGNPTPVIEAPMKDVLSGKWEIEAPLSTVSSNGCNLYLPIPYAKGCKVTSDEGNFYFIINHRSYEAGTVIKSFTINDLKDFAPSISVAQTELQTPPKNVTDPLFLMQGTLGPGESNASELPIGPSAVSRMWVEVHAEDLEKALRTTIVRMNFDGAETVWCPLGDFFFSGVGFNQFDSWFNAAKRSEQLISRWTMPYRQRASIKIENVGDAPVTLKVHHRTTAWDWDERSMYFHARWRQQGNIPTRPMIDWNYIEANGKGVYVGDCLTILNPVPEWWGEGDEKIYVDGEKFPSHFGTGTEDYYGYAWSSPKKFQHAFHAQPRSDGEPLNNTRGYATVFRTRTLDAIPFTKSIKTDMEIWHWVECNVTYAVSTFYYAMAGATDNRKPEPEQAALGVPKLPPPPPPFRIEGAVEAEQAVVRTAIKAETIQQEMIPFGRGKWSNEAHLWVKGTEAGCGVELEIPAPAAGPQRLVLYATRSWDYTDIKVSINGKAAEGAAGTRIDMYSTQQGVASPTGPIDLGVFEPVNGKFILRAEAVGPNAAMPAGTNRWFFGLDCIVIKPAK
jgi:hypothetical protein